MAALQEEWVDAASAVPRDVAQGGTPEDIISGPLPSPGRACSGAQPQTSDGARDGHISAGSTLSAHVMEQSALLQEQSSDHGGALHVAGRNTFSVSQPHRLQVLAQELVQLSAGAEVSAEPASPSQPLASVPLRTQLPSYPYPQYRSKRTELSPGRLLHIPRTLIEEYLDVQHVLTNGICIEIETNGVYAPPTITATVAVYRNTTGHSYYRLLGFKGVCSDYHGWVLDQWRVVDPITVRMCISWPTESQRHVMEQTKEIIANRKRVSAAVSVSAKAAKKAAKSTSSKAVVEALHQMPCRALPKTPPPTCAEQRPLIPDMCEASADPARVLTVHDGSYTKAVDSEGRVWYMAANSLVPTSGGSKAPSSCHETSLLSAAADAHYVRDSSTLPRRMSGGGGTVLLEAPPPAATMFNSNTRSACWQRTSTPYRPHVITCTLDDACDRSHCAAACQQHPPVHLQTSDPSCSSQPSACVRYAFAAPNNTQTYAPNDVQFVAVAEDGTTTYIYEAPTATTAAAVYTQSTQELDELSMPPQIVMPATMNSGDPVGLRTAEDDAPQGVVAQTTEEVGMNAESLDDENVGLPALMPVTAPAHATIKAVLTTAHGSEEVMLVQTKNGLMVVPSESTSSFTSVQDPPSAPTPPITLPTGPSTQPMQLPARSMTPRQPRSKHTFAAPAQSAAHVQVCRMPPPYALPSSGGCSTGATNNSGATEPHATVVLSPPPPPTMSLHPVAMPQSVSLAPCVLAPAQLGDSHQLPNPVPVPLMQRSINRIRALAMPTAQVQVQPEFHHQVSPSDSGGGMPCVLEVVSGMERPVAYPILNHLSVGPGALSSGYHVISAPKHPLHEYSQVMSVAPDGWHQQVVFSMPTADASNAMPPPGTRLVMAVQPDMADMAATATASGAGNNPVSYQHIQQVY